MKTVIVTLQEENWEDDGGEHHAFVAEVSDEIFSFLKDDMEIEEGDEIFGALEAGRNSDVIYPLSIDGLFNIWYV